LATESCLSMKDMPKEREHVMVTQSLFGFKLFAQRYILNISDYPGLSVQD